MSSLGGVPTTKAYWEIKADQVLNRVFDAETAIEVEVVERPPQAPVAAASRDVPAPAGAAAQPDPAPLHSGARRRPKPRSWPAWMGHQPGLVLAGIGVTGMIATGGSLLLIGLWSQSQQALRQERNLLLLERLRNLGPAVAEPAAAPAAPAGTTDSSAGGEAGLPPPPPNEPWMQELASLPSEGAPTAAPLNVPVSPRITSPAPAATGAARTGSPATGGAAPQLVGVVQVPGRSGSAIFQVGSSSTSAGVGESIGTSGWRLVSVAGDSAVIERGGDQRRVSISSGF